MRVGNKRTAKVTLHRNVAAQVENRKQQEFFELAERFRAATDSEEVRRLGDQMGRMIFSD
jgi:hypothetical protein